MRNKNNDIKYFTQNELKKFFKIIEDSKNDAFWLRDLTMFNLIYFLGLRISEVGLLKLSDIKENGEIYIKRLKGSNNNTLRLDKKRLSLLNKYIKAYKGNKFLYQIHDDYDFLFKTKKGKQINHKNGRYIFKKYAKLSNLPPEKLHPHILKHSIGVHLAESGFDIKDLQHYLGHKNINNTIIYFSYTTTQLNHFYQKLEKNYNLV